jgi:hypothetical protein
VETFNPFDHFGHVETFYPFDHFGIDV